MVSRMKIFFRLLLTLLLISFVSADAITDVNLWIGADGYTWVEEKIIIEDGAKTSSELIIPRMVSDFTIADEIGRLNYTIEHKEGFDIVNFSFQQVESSDEKTVRVKYGTPHLTRKDGVNWTISYFTQATARRTIVRVNFPVGGVFTYLTPEKLLRSYEKYAIWIFPQDEYLDFNCTYGYTGNTQGNNITAENNSSIINPPKDNPPIVSPLALALIFIAVLVVSGILYLAWRMELFKREIKDKKDDAITVSVEKEGDVIKGPSIVGNSLKYDMEGGSAKKGRKKVKDSVIKMLEENEITVVKVLENSVDEEVTQAYIHKTTGIPKSSLSDIIGRLEKRNILKKNSHGRIKWLKFQEWVLD